MPIQIPGQRESLQPVSGTVPVLPSGSGRGLRQLGEGLRQAGNAAFGVDEAQANELQAEIAAQKRQENERLQAQLELDRKKKATEIYQAETALSDMARQFTTNLQATRKGSNAYGVTTEAQDWWNTTIDQVGNTLQDDDTRELFKQRSASIRESHLNSISSYEANQTNQAMTDAATGKIGSSVAFAAANAGNPGAVSQSRKDIIETIDTLSKIFGWLPRQRQFEMEKNLTVMHIQVIQNLAAASPEAATKYFEDFKPEIKGDLYKEIGDILNQSDYRIGGQKIVDDLMSQNLTFDQREAQVKKLAEGGKRDYAMNLLDNEKRDAAAKDKAVEEANVDFAFRQFGPSQRISSIDPVTWAKLDGRIQQTLREKERIAKAGEKEETDFGNYDTLNRMSALNPDQFIRINLNTLMLSTEDKKHFSNMQQQIINGGNKSIATWVAKKGDAMEGLDPKERDSFSRAADDAAERMMVDKHRELLPEEERKILNDLRAEQVDPSTGYFSFTRNDQAVGVQVGRIPPTEKAKIEKDLTDRGIPVSDAAILRLYNAGK